MQHHATPLPLPKSTGIVRCRLSQMQCILTVVFATRVAQPDFLSWILFSDELCFTQDGVLNLHNMHVWVHENPRCTRAHAHQQRFIVNVWAGFIGDMLIGDMLIGDMLMQHICLNLPKACKKEITT